LFGEWAWVILAAPKKTVEEEGEGPSPERSPIEELSSFQLSDGLQIQLVAAEPMVQDPVVIMFDPDGRLWVVEMRGFMPDIDGNGEMSASAGCLFWKTQMAMEKWIPSRIYIDSLVMPRSLALVPGGCLGG
jgi:hypothetical protein